MTLEGGNIGFRPFLRNDPLNASLLPPFQTSRIQMELLSPERLREMTFLRSKKGGLPGSEGKEMTFLRSKKGGLPGSEGESSSIYRHQENDTSLAGKNIGKKKGLRKAANKRERSCKPEAHQSVKRKPFFILFSFRLHQTKELELVDENRFNFQI